MDKNDLYFIVSILLALLAFFGIDWGAIRGKASILPNKWRQRFLLFAIVGGLVVSGIGWYKSTHRNCLKWTKTQADEQKVYQQHFRNQEVELDGKRFDHCTFENVTLIYHGLAPVDFVESTFVTNPGGSLLIKTDNDAAKGFASLSTFIKTMPNVGEIVVGEADESGNLKVITKEERSNTQTGSPPKP